MTVASVIVCVATVVSIVSVPVVVVVLSEKDCVAMSVSVLTIGETVVFWIDVANIVEVIVGGETVVAKRLEQPSIEAATAEAH